MTYGERDVGGFVLLSFQAADKKIYQTLVAKSLSWE
jgi:hypothetical protein